METQLTLYQPQTFDEIQAVGKVLAGSGYFNDAKGPAQAVAKIMAGQELGIPAMASLTGIYFFDGKITIGANIMAQLVKRHPKYDYRVVHLTDTSCEIAFFERVGAGREELGKSSFTIEEARRANLTSKANWTRYPRNMLFSRAISNGIKWYCPDVSSSGPLYTPDEMGYAVDDNGELVIDGNYRPVQDRDDHQADHAPEIIIEDPPEPRVLTKTETRELYDYAKACTLSKPNLMEALDVSDIAEWSAVDPLTAGKRAVDAWLEHEISNHADDQDQSDAMNDDGDLIQPPLIDDDTEQTKLDQYSEGA
jgi:hypothetical protein